MGSRVLVIAEAGVNHNGSPETARRLADAALAAGADVVKYQVFKASSLASARARKAAYQEETVGAGGSQADMLRSLELSFGDFLELKEYCDGIGIRFLATSFDAESTRFLAEEVGQRLFKVPSGEITNWPYLVHIAGYGLPVILSTGMSGPEEVDAAVGTLRGHGAGRLTVLHCNTQYPTPFRDVNLLAMPALGARYGAPYGYSDHTRGIEVPVAAVAMGATVIEKHFTLDRGMEGPDHKASLEPAELTAMVSAIRNVEEALGSAEKRVSPSEEANRAVARKSIVAARAIRAGEPFTEENLVAKRPGTGLSPMLWPEVIGRTAKRDFAEDEEVEL